MKTRLASSLALVLAASLVGFGLAPASAEEAAATEPVPAAPVFDESTPTVDSNATPDELPVMGDYALSEFSAAAAEIDPELADAAQRDLGLGIEEYLAEGEAATDGATVLEALQERSAGVVGGKVTGTELTVYVTDAEAAKLAESTGARVSYDAPPTAPEAEFGPAADLYSGQPYGSMVTSNSWYRCSTAFNGRALAGSGAYQTLTAGHCYKSAYPTLRALNFTKANDDDPKNSPKVTVGAPLGSWVSGTPMYGNGADTALIAVNTANFTPKSGLLAWGGGKGAPNSGAKKLVTTSTSTVAGAPICKTGSTSGWTCGRVIAVDQTVDVAGHPVNSIRATACLIPGDSGGAAVVGTSAVGVNSSTTLRASCGQSGYQSGYAPMVSKRSGANNSVAGRLGGNWEPLVTVKLVPKVTSLPANTRVFAGGTLSGTATNVASGNYLKIQFSGETKVRTAKIVNGKWSVSLAGLTPGTKSFTMRGAWGKWSIGAPVSGSLRIIAKPSVVRYAGADRYSTSVAISKAAYPNGAKTVFIATGANYPDALGAGPIAAKEHAPLLLTGRTLPASVTTELKRLKPTEIVIVGGTGAVPTSVGKALGKYANKVSRLAGKDRFDTSRKLIKRGFPTSAPSVYVATGMNFPDALSTGAAAGAKGRPVLLVNGTRPLDATTKSFLKGLKTTSATITGGTGAVSSRIQSDLKAAGISTTRVSGGDRYATSEAIGRVSFPTFKTMYFATGRGFADALAGSAIAGAQQTPLFIVPGSCVPGSMITDALNQGVTQVRLLGGTGVVSSAVGSLKRC